MEFQEVLRRRRMVRNFDDRPLEPEVVERILANGLRAPSAGFSQGWAFLVLEGREETERFWSSTFDPAEREGFRWKGLFRAPLLVVALSNKQEYLDRYAEPDKGWTDRDETRWPVPYWDIDTGMAALQMLLTAVDAGLGAVFFGVRDQAKLRETFSVPGEYTAIGTIAVGHSKPKDRPSPSLKLGHRKSETVVHRGRWW